MKKTFLLVAIFLFIITSTTHSQIKVNSSGYVGINNSSPSYRLDVSGTVKFAASGRSITFDGSDLIPYPGDLNLGNSSNYWFRLYSTFAFFTYDPVIMSDEKYKLNITDITGMINKVKLLRPVTYKLNTEALGVSIDETMNKSQYGFISQELQEIFPEMVSKLSDDKLGIHYTQMIPVLVQALKEQQTQIEALSARVSELEKAAK